MSGGALKVGDLYVVVSASIDGFQKSMKQVADDVARVAKKVEGIAAKMAGLGTVLAASLGGFLAGAKQLNEGVSRELENLADIGLTFASEVGSALLPFLRELGAVLTQLLGAFQSLSPETRTALASWLAYAATAGIAAGAVGKVAGAVGGLADGLSFVLSGKGDGLSKMLLGLKGASTATQGALLGFFNSVIAGAKGLPGAAVGAVKSLGSAVAGLPGAVAAGGSAVKDFLVGLPALARGAAAGVGSFAKGLPGAFAGAASSIGGLAKSLPALIWSFASALPGAIASGAAAIGGLVLPILAVVAVIAAVVLAIGALYKAWNDKSTGFRDRVMSWVETLKGWGKSVASFFSETFNGVMDTLKTVGMAILDAFAWVIRKTADLMAPLAERVGGRFAETVKKMQGLTGEDLLGGIKATIDMAKRGIAYGLSGLKELKDDIAGYFKGDGKVTRRRAYEVGTSASDGGAGGSRALLELGRSGGMGPAMRTMMEAEAKRTAEALADAMKAARERIEDARKSIESRVRGLFSAVTDLVDVFQEAMTASGGNAMAGLAALAAQLLSQSTQFGQLVTMVCAFIQRVADTLGHVLAPVLPLLASAFDVVAPLLDALTPALEMLLAPLGDLAPLLQVVAAVVQGLAPIITLVAQAMVLIQNPLLLFTNVVLRGLFEVLRGVGLTVLTIARALADGWNGIVGAVQSVLRMLGNLSIFGAKPLSFLNDLAKGLDAIKVPTEGMADAMTGLRNATWESAQAAAAASAAQWQNTEALNKATESLTNVPAGYKRLNELRYQVQDAASAPSMGGSSAGSGGGASSGGSAGSAEAPLAGGDIVFNVGDRQDAVELLRELNAEQRRNRSRRSGNALLLGNRFAGAY